MKKNDILLLKTLLMSTNQINIYRNTYDKKKQNKIMGSFIGVAVIYIMLMVYSVSLCIGYGQSGIIDSVPVMCALTISMLGFVFTLFKTNGYLFNFKEYDMLMSLPFEAKTVAGCKFLYMYIKSMPLIMSISLAMMAGYGYYAKPSFFTYPLWLILTVFIPIIPMLIASFFGFLIARISAGFRKTNIFQTVLTFAFVILCFSLRFFIEDMFRDDKVEQTMTKISGTTEGIAKYYLPAKWFNAAVTRFSVVDILLIIGISAVLFAVVFSIVGKSYRNINSALKSHAAARKFRMSQQKTKSVVNAIAFKEFKRLTGSTTYMVNGAMGEILAVLFSAVALIFGFDNIISKVVQGAPLTSQMLQPAIPFIVYFFIGMVATTVCSPSLEGKNYWIMQSLPITKKTMYQGKMLFNMYLSVPFMELSILLLCIATKTPLINTIVYLVLGFTLCAFSTAWGCVCGVKHIKLEWENEVEVIKQGAAVLIYMLPNMFVVMGLCVLVVFLGTRMNHLLLAGIFIIITGVMALLSYRRVLSLAKK